jgi:murein DD-endopeptidase MepM/ murein hydrolase activator NlpD
MVAGAGAVSMGSAKPAEAQANLGATVTGFGSDTETVRESVHAIGTESDSEDRVVAISRSGGREPIQGTASAAAQRAADRAAGRRAQARDAVLDAIEEASDKRAKEIAAEIAAEKAANQWVLPVSGYHITATFGQGGGLWAADHTGLDFAAASGAPIKAVAAGVVSATGYEGAYGNQTTITHEDGTQTTYSHQTSTTVSVGQQVAAGDVIGYVGSTGNTTGPHLHLEVLTSPDTPVDPYAVLVDHGLQP